MSSRSLGFIPSTGYRTTSDQLVYRHDSGFVSGSYSYESGDHSRVVGDGQPLSLNATEFDSGRKQKNIVHKINPPPLVTGSTPHAPLRQYASAMVPPVSNYHTHRDQRHPKQRMIAPSIGANITRTPRSSSQSPLDLTPRETPGHIVVTATRLSRETERSSSSPHIMTERRKRSVSPQMRRPVRHNESEISGSPKPQYEPYLCKEKTASSHTGSVVTVGAKNSKVYASKMISLSAGKPVNVLKFRRITIDMSIQEYREESFINHQPTWSNTSVPYKLLVYSGFYYTGQEDNVKCYACQIEMGNWKRVDNVLERHFAYSPNCKYIRTTSLSVITNEICPKIFSFYSEFANRYRSLQLWPISSVVSGRRLADAGFFYTNDGIRTQCYSCGIVKDDWKSGDDPITIHYTLCSTCPHMMNMADKNKIPTVITGPATYKVKYETFDDRLKSYKNLSYQDMMVDPVELAQAGFVLVSMIPLTVQCTSCDITVSDWEKGDNPAIKHAKLSPDCDLIKDSIPKDLETFTESSLTISNKFTKKVSIDDDDDGIQYPPSYNPSISVSSNESISLPNQYSFDKDDEGVLLSLPPSVKRSVSSKDDNELCIVCFENNKECAIVPCGHFCVCKACADKLRHCPICRQTKHSILKIYVP